MYVVHKLPKPDVAQKHQQCETVTTSYFNTLEAQVRQRRNEVASSIDELRHRLKEAKKVVEDPDSNYRYGPIVLAVLGYSDVLIWHFVSQASFLNDHFEAAVQKLYRAYYEVRFHI